MATGSEPSAAAREFYDDVWASFGHLHAANPAVRHRHRLVAARVAATTRGMTPRVLDAGCGMGELLEVLAARVPGARLAGGDVAPRSLAATRRRGVDADLFALDLLDPDFTVAHVARLGGYDVVVCSEVLEHLADDLTAVRHLSALLAPGGHLVVTVPGGTRSRFDVRIGHLRHYTRRTLATLLAEAGLTPVEVTAWGFPFHDAYRTAVRTASRFTFAAPATTSAATRAAATPLSPTLERLYTLGGRLLYPLYFLNTARCGEQLIAVARGG